MPKTRNDENDTTTDASAKAVQRREALKGLGALVAAPAFALACGNSDNGGGGSGTGGAVGNGGTPGNGGATANGGAPGNGGTPGMGGAPGNGGAPPANGGAPGNGGAMQQTGMGGKAANGGSANGGSGVTGGTSANGGAASGGTSTGAGGSSAGAGGTGGGGGGDLVAPKFDDVPMCTASKTDGAGQGPFMIHDLEKDDDISLRRQDIRGRYNMSAAPGVEMQLHLRILDSTSTSCNGKPVPDIDVYIWHTDGQGFYSGFGTRGGADEQKPDAPYNGTPGSNNLENTDRFNRGVQTTDANGIVSFRSIFPGWYNGRDVHIHFVAFKKGSMAVDRKKYPSYDKSNSNGFWLFTTQFYFDPAFTDSVHTKYDPYKARTTGSLASAYQGAIKADENGNSGLHAKATMNGDIVVAQMQILLNPA